MSFRSECTFCKTHFFQFFGTDRSCYFHYGITYQVAISFFPENNQVMCIEVKTVFFREVRQVKYTNLTSNLNTFGQFCIQKCHGIFRIFEFFAFNLYVQRFACTLENCSGHGSERNRRTIIHGHERNVNIE
ncbi:hypothetical protein D3C80_1479720 [compost metagenome]